jgi:alpha-beta hydrolase superfamily lysophospholipase
VVLRYAPKPLAVLCAWIAAVLALIWAASTGDPVGRVLAVTAVALLGALALTGTVVRPRLAADVDELRAGRLRGARHWPWRDVHRLDVVRTRRLGRDSRVLEIDVTDPDGTEHLLVFTQLDLGADPVDAAAALRELSAGRCR